MSQIVGAVLLGGLFIGIERQADGTIADRMRENLNAFMVEFGHELFVFLGIPQQFSCEPRIIGVRLEHRSSVSFDDPVKENLGRAGSDPVIVVALLVLNNFLQLTSGHLRRIKAIGQIKPQREFPGAAEFLKKIDILQIVTACINAPSTCTRASPTWLANLIPARKACSFSA